MQDLRETLPDGTLLHDRYLVEKLLGRGGFSAVYLVRDQRVRQNIYALKEVIDPKGRDKVRFTFEAELLRRVDHASLPRVYRMFEDDTRERAYMLMDYIDGPNLEQLRKKQPEKRFSVQQVLSIMGPIMHAVSYLHEQQPPIVHRDIKPANIIVPTSGDEAVLVDFGIAKEFDPEATTTAVRHASPGYGAPEQYGTGTNTRTDIYGLAATIYTLLTGIVPTNAFYRTTQMGSRGIDPLEPIQHYAPDVPQHISNAIYRAMAVDSEKRFATVEEFWHALNNQSETPVAPAPAVAPIVLLSPPAELNTPVPLSEGATTVSDVAVPGAGRRNRRRISVGLLLLLLLLIIGVSAAVFLPGLLSQHGGRAATTPTATATHKPGATVTHTATSTTTPTSSPTSTPTTTATAKSDPSPAPGFPTLGNQYNGSLHDVLGNQNASMALTTVHQSGGNIQGQFQVGSPLSGNGFFTGVVNTSNGIHFTVTSNQVGAPLFFTGTINSNGSLSGSYCSLDSSGNCNHAVGGYGNWQVSPSTSGSGS